MTITMTDESGWRTMGFNATASPEIRSKPSQPAKSGYAARVTVLAAMGLVLALLANVVVYVLGRFS